jgi:CubicO group peptidase (beta-lactamase class C family)
VTPVLSPAPAPAPVPTPVPMPMFLSLPPSRAGRRARTLLAALLSLLAAHRADAQRASPAALRARIDSLVGVPIAAGQVAGATVAVVRGADTIVHRGYGRANLELAVATPRDAIYEIGSVTKQFTGVAILQLAGAGRLSLDDDVTRHVPGYDTQGRRVTVRRLLDHTSGIRGYTEMPEFGALAPQALPRDTLLRLVERRPFDFEPGTSQAYNNSAFFLAGLVIEKASGMPYEQYVQERLFAPAGMAASHYCSEFDVKPGKTSGYDWGGARGLIQKRPLSHRWPYAAGSLCSTARDLVAWNEALHRGTRLLSPALYRELLATDTLLDGTRVRYAKGLSQTPVLGRPALHHGGGINGWTAYNLYVPADSLSVVVLFNTSGPASPEATAMAIAEAVLGRAPAPPAVPLAGDAARFAGEYVGTGRGGAALVLRVIAEGDGLVVQQGPTRRPLVHLGGGSFASDGIRYHFREAAGAVAALRYDTGAGNVLLTRRGG